MNNYILYSDKFDPHHNLALETKLMEAIRPGDLCMYLWQNKHTVVIGRNQNAWKECRCELLREEGGVLARRSSGGGAVYHDLGNLNFTFAASPERYDLHAQLELILSALASIGINGVFSGRNDITVDGKKFSGNAFKHTANCSMQHGTLLISVDMARLSRYLRPPESKLKAKGIESVRARVCNLTDINPALTIDAMKSLLERAFHKKHGGAQTIAQSDFDLSDLYPRYASWDWNYGETPRFDVQLETRFDWGGVELLLSLHQGKVASAQVYTDAMDAEIAEKIELALIGADYGTALADRLAFLPALADWLRGELPA
ncbi:MAG: lipoate--protein ligase [Christensenellales bacterium]|jgi:lipoate-protein ligase A